MSEASQETVLSNLRSTKGGLRERTLKELYQAHYPVIVDMVVKNSGKKEDAADIFQDALIVLYEKVRKNELVLNCTIRTYLYSVARNLWFNRIRKLQRETALEDQAKTIPIEPEALTILESSEQTNLVMNLLNQLGESCQQVIRYYYYEQLKMKEIAKKMGFANDQIAKNKKSTCLKKLRNLVAQTKSLAEYLQS